MVVALEHNNFTVCAAAIFLSTFTVFNYKMLLL